MFGAIASDKEAMKHIESYRGSGRKHKNVPDAPYSLQEGIAGDICFYADLFDPMNAYFPGYELG